MKEENYEKGNFQTFLEFKEKNKRLNNEENWTIAGILIWSLILGIDSLANDLGLLRIMAVMSAGLIIAFLGSNLGRLTKND